jgi:hypothetical protein
LSFEAEVDQSVRYLKSDEAHRALAVDAYWPKWHAPWWHMLLLHEMGQAARIPGVVVEQYVTALNRLPLKIFPIQPEDLPAGVDPFRGTPCHCQLGNVYQVVAACGVDVDAELPWIRPWFLAYQMADGGLNCDNDAYLVTHECPSSMVGTIAAFEAVLLHTQRPWTRQELVFLDKAAHFLMERELRLGSPTEHNAAERVSAESWLKLCFPRFYFYDVLRGLNALVLWAEKLQQPLPQSAFHSVAAHLTGAIPGGAARIGRRSYDGVLSLTQASEGEWLRRQAATTFPLLDAVSGVGEVSPYLSKQWADTQRRMARLTTAVGAF